MRRMVMAASAAVFTGAMMTVAAAPASAATGQVAVFETEFTAVTTYSNPTGCQKLPIGAHVLFNQTDSPVTIYTDPLCVIPNLTVQPGYGSHVSPMLGSFSTPS